ncbi:MAG: hypothetical protein COZ86_02300 [Candidatus Moranbacteria bacterium CG_4_8_14_3_um_filter_41_13]|nr:MAG: hypothetical protein COZ86_02300 [Candidatus Moranbacteria bacterium CG_4_8_14_3_um_filter_41_13]
MARLTTKDLPLGELYTKPKITPSVEIAILAKEDFSDISKTYCERVCILPCKNPTRVSLLNKPVDILIVQDHPEPRGKYDYRDDQRDLINRGIIQTLAEKAGFGRLSYQVTNLLKCPNDLKNFPKGKSPAQRTMMKCRPYLLGEIERVKPKVIISLTTTVTKSLGLLKHSNTGNRGEITSALGSQVVITLHPKCLTMIRQNASGAMWSYDYFEVIRRDFEKAARLARGDLKLLTLEEGVQAQVPNISICQSIEDVREAVAKLSSFSGTGSITSIDTETNTLDPMAIDAKLLTIQFGWRDGNNVDYKGEPVYKAAVIPLWHRGNTFYDPDEAWALLVPVLLDPLMYKVGHNIKFDILMIFHTTGIRLQGVKFDTLLLLHDLDSGAQGTFSLKTAIWDFAPELSIGGYENLLPKLTKGRSATTGTTEGEDGNEEGESGDGSDSNEGSES